MNPESQIKPTSATKKARTLAAASFKKEAKQKEERVENEKASPVMKGADRVNERSRGSNGQNAGVKQDSPM